MAPPKVSVASKTPETEPGVETQLQTKPDKLDLPPVALVTVESERNVRAAQAQRARSRNYRVMAAVIVVIIVILACLGTMRLVHHLRQKHRSHLHCRYGKGELPEHVKVDHQNHLIYAQHQRDEDAQTPALHVLHEYDRGLVAYKDEEKNVCYIDRLEETFETGYTRWLSYEKHGHRGGRTLARVSPRPIEREVLRHVGDIHIYMHCVSGTSFWFMEIDEKEETDMEVVHI